MKKIVYALAFLLCVFFVAAAPKFQGTDSTVDALTISYLKNDVYPKGGTFDFHFHLFSSNFSEVNGNNATCRLHIYNDTNEHIGIYIVPADPTGGYEISIGNNVTNRTGMYPYIIYCQATTPKEYGYFSSVFYVTPDGNSDRADAWILVALIIFIPLFLSFLLMKWADSLGQDHNVFKIFLSLLAFVPIFSALHFGALSVVRYFSWVEMENYLGDFSWWFGIMFFTFIVYFIIYLIIKAIHAAAQKKNEDLKY
jgi:hypothetical protein